MRAEKLEKVLQNDPLHLVSPKYETQATIDTYLSMESYIIMFINVFCSYLDSISIDLQLLIL